MHTRTRQWNNTRDQWSCHRLPCLCIADDTLLGLLLDKAPAIKQLTASRLELTTDAHAARTWGLERLALHNHYMDAFTTELLLRLPRRESGRVEIRAGFGNIAMNVTSVEVSCVCDQVNHATLHLSP